MKAEEMIFTLFLLRFAAEDLRKKSISGRELAWFILAGAGFFLAGMRGASSAEKMSGLLLALLPAFLLFLSGRTMGGAAGEGDALFFLGTAGYLSWRECLLLFCGSAALLGITGMIALAAASGSACLLRVRKKRLPYLPFVLAVWALMAGLKVC